jgi:hypothetical protein
MIRQRQKKRCPMTARRRRLERLEKLQPPKRPACDSGSMSNAEFCRLPMAERIALAKRLAGDGHACAPPAKRSFTPEEFRALPLRDRIRVVREEITAPST